MDVIQAERLVQDSCFPLCRASASESGVCTSLAEERKISGVPVKSVACLRCSKTRTKMHLRLTCDKCAKVCVFISWILQDICIHHQPTTCTCIKCTSFWYGMFCPCMVVRGHLSTFSRRDSHDDDLPFYFQTKSFGRLSGMIRL